jgi:hypothetical protein
MDLEAAVIRAEMSQTRHAIDAKIDRLEQRARELTPRRYWERPRPEFLLDQVIGGALTVVGLALAVRHYRRKPAARPHPHAAYYREYPYFGT